MLVKVGKSEKGLDIFDFSRFRPILYNIDFFLVSIVCLVRDTVVCIQDIQLSVCGKTFIGMGV